MRLLVTHPTESRGCIDGRKRTPPLVRLKAVCVPGDQGEPVITVMMPNSGSPPMTIRIRGLLLLTLTLGACAAAAASARLLAGGIDVRGMEMAWVSWRGEIDRVRRARRMLEDLERKHGARPAEQWPADDRCVRAIATRTLRELGEEP